MRSEKRILNIKFYAMKNSNRSGEISGVKKTMDKPSSDLVYVKLPDKKPVPKTSSRVNPPDLNDAAQKAESKRRIRAINPTNETW